MKKIILRNQATSIFLGRNRIIGILARKIKDVIAAIYINDDRQNRCEAPFSKILEFI